MESAKDLISCDIPAIPFETGPFNRSPSPNERIPSDWIRPWTSFTTNIQEILNILEFSGKVGYIEPNEGEQNYVVGNKFGLITQLTRHVCEPVAKALSVTPLKGILFGYAETRIPLLFNGPDITLFDDVPRTEPGSGRAAKRPVIAVGKVKTFWTFSLEYEIVEDRASDLNDSLEGPVGDLAHHMRKFRLKHGFLTTYNATVFVRRVEDYKFEVSPPIEFGKTVPSVRECSLGFSVIASRDTVFTQSSECSTRVTYVESIMFARKATGVVTCTQPIGQAKDRSKAVMQVTLESGQRALAKCWREEHAESYFQVAVFYDMLQPPPNPSHDYPFFPAIPCYGEIVCSSLFPEGYIPVLSWVEGPSLSLHWPWPRDNIKSDPAYNHIRKQCREAVAVLRRLGIYLLDSGPHNVFFDRGSGRVSMIDFEFYGMYMAEKLKSPWMRRSCEPFLGGIKR